MIELTQVKNTDKLGQLQGILNTAFSEIKTDQPFIGKVVNPSINMYTQNPDDGSYVLNQAITASAIMGNLYALCFPESNGVFVANVFGHLRFNFIGLMLARLVVDVPSVKLATRDANVGTFVSPSHLGLSDNTTHAAGAAFLNEGNALRMSITQDGTTCNLTLTPVDGSRNVSSDFPMDIFF